MSARFTRRNRLVSWVVAATFVACRFDRWGCRLLGHDLGTPNIPMCWRCLRGWETWEQAVTDRSLERWR